MTLPLPIDPDFRKVCVGFWLDDIEDRLEVERLEDAELSWKEANSLYLTLPPGCGDLALEDRLFQMRVKLDKLTDS
jgi:hypothetical protein